jgi:hypothetical protein
MRFYFLFPMSVLVSVGASPEKAGIVVVRMLAPPHRRPQKPVAGWVC